MRLSISGMVLLGGACMTAALALGQQSQSPVKQTTGSLEVAVVYNPLRANVVGGKSFWMQGGGIQVHGQFWHGLGVVADVSGLHEASTNGSSVGLDLVTAAFGPRYTWSPAPRRYALFGQVLAGEANGLNSVFPNAAGATDSAQSVALYVGGGFNLHLTHHLSARAFEVDWLRTQLPNATTSVQNNVRLGAGLIYQFK